MWHARAVQLKIKVLERPGLTKEGSAATEQAWQLESSVKRYREPARALPVVVGAKRPVASESPFNVHPAICPQAHRTLASEAPPGPNQPVKTRRVCQL